LIFNDIVGAIRYAFFGSGWHTANFFNYLYLGIAFAGLLDRPGGWIDLLIWIPPIIIYSGLDYVLEYKRKVKLF